MLNEMIVWSVEGQRGVKLLILGGDLFLKVRFSAYCLFAYKFADNACGYASECVCVYMGMVSSKKPLEI